MTSKLPKERDHPFLVDGDNNEGIKGGEESDGASRDCEMGSKVSVRQAGLVEEEC